jgi:integrase/recombinase XerC
LFLAAKAAEGAAAKTLTWYAMILRRAVTSFGDGRPVDSLAGPELRAWLLELRTTLSPISVAGYVRTLKVLGNWLAAEELSPATALRSLRKPRVPNKLIEPVGDDAMRRLLGIASVRDRAILLLLLDTGLRVSEAAGLRLGDLRPDGTLKVRGKGSKERIVPVGSTARSAIVRYLGQRGTGSADDALFLGRRGPLDARGIQQLVRRLKTRIGVTARLSPHSLRHTFARSYLVNGGDVFSLQRILGHTTLDMVKRYVALPTSISSPAMRWRRLRTGWRAGAGGRLLGPRGLHEYGYGVRKGLGDNRHVGVHVEDPLRVPARPDSPWIRFGGPPLTVRKVPPRGSGLGFRRKMSGTL